MASGVDDSTFTRRKFTITESLDERLVEFAGRHYQGNVSLCIRSAIEDHQQTLEGEGKLALSRLAAQMEQLENQQTGIQEQLQELDDAMNAPSTSTVGVVSDGDYTDTKELVRSELSIADDGLRIDDLMERLPLSLPEIQSALGLLVDQGLVVDRHTNRERFWIVGDCASTREETNE